MRLPDEVQESVVFLGVRSVKGPGVEYINYGGTAFFLTAPSPSHVGVDITYLVTARHVAEKIEHGEFFVRANTDDGGSETVLVDAGLEQTTWWYHPNDDSVDVAVMPFAPRANWRQKRIPARMILTRKKMTSKGIGVGDEVYATGLFHFVTGQQKNLPIVRTGTIAMVPDERVPLGRWRTPDMEAYLIEARSLGGLSGSPVFAQRSIKVHPAEHSGRQPIAAGAIFLLGLIHGHWDLPDEAIDATGDGWAQPREKINIGIAIVVPADKILEVLEQPKLKDVVRQAEYDLASQHPEVLDGGSPQTVRKGSEKVASEHLTSAVSAVATPDPR